MKKILYVIIIFGLITSSCEDVVELDTPTGESRLNIDAHFRVFTDEQPIRATGQVVLTETVNFFDETIPTVSGATVIITERDTNNEYIFTEIQPESGIYEINNLLFLNNFDAIFDLRIEVGDEIYISSAKPITSAPIIDIQQGDLEIFGEEDLEIIVTISDTPIVENYYLLDYGFALYLTLEDEFFNGNDFEFSFLYTEDDEVNLQTGDTITVINDGIDEQFFTYMELLLEQTGSGGLFSSPPATVRGNIVNSQNPEKYPFGYFRISEAFSIDYMVQDD
ncbi:DUF4249 family protein [Kordia jejudonensis]|uniref:DUF4249 family protein n=1 Tax=Kordia jejudonensis TaxID=1348245 RepID=UPI0006296379|nr:DUF4249 family protein [Kordia jejudonensis]